MSDLEVSEKVGEVDAKDLGENGIVAAFSVDTYEANEAAVGGDFEAAFRSFGKGGRSDGKVLNSRDRDGATVGGFEASIGPACKCDWIVKGFDCAHVSCWGDVSVAHLVGNDPSANYEQEKREPW